MTLAILSVVVAPPLQTIKRDRPAAWLPIDETKMAAALDAMRMVELQANETITLGEMRPEQGEETYAICDELAGVVLWESPIPRKPYDQDRAWKAAQEKLDELRRRRVVLAIVAAVSL